MQLSMWVFFYIVSIFWGLKFPFHYQSYQTNGKLRYIHAGMIIASIFLPLIPALLPFGVHGYGYSLRVPPNHCTPVDSYIYVYPVVLPLAILGLTSFFLLLNVFWIVGNLKVFSSIIVALYHQQYKQKQNIYFYVSMQIYVLSTEG